MVRERFEMFPFQSSASTSGGDHAFAEFRANLEASDRECASGLLFAQLLHHRSLIRAGSVFSLAQESMRQVKAWYESSDRAR